MDHENSIAARRGMEDEGQRATSRLASRSAENEARIVAHLRAVLLGCGRSPVWG
jgi:hypothetical protein